MSKFVRTKSRVHLGARKEQQDRVFHQSGIRFDHPDILDKTTVMFVADGHGDGGGDAAEFVRTQLVTKMQRMASRNKHLSFEDVVRLTIKKLHDAFEKGKVLGGTTLSGAVIDQETDAVYMFNIGDSQTCLFSSEFEPLCTHRHNVTTSDMLADTFYEKDEFKTECTVDKETSVGAGDGYIFRKGEGLNMTRSIGDTFMNPCIQREPEVFKTKTDKNSLLVSFSDGLMQHETELKKHLAQHKYGSEARTRVDKLFASNKSSFDDDVEELFDHWELPRTKYYKNVPWDNMSMAIAHFGDENDTNFSKHLKREPSPTEIDIGSLLGYTRN